MQRYKITDYCMDLFPECMLYTCACTCMYLNLIIVLYLPHFAGPRQSLTLRANLPPPVIQTMGGSVPSVGRQSPQTRCSLRSQCTLTSPDSCTSVMYYIVYNLWVCLLCTFCMYSIVEIVKYTSNKYSYTKFV